MTCAKIQVLAQAQTACLTVMHLCSHVWSVLRNSHCETQSSDNLVLHISLSELGKRTPQQLVQRSCTFWQRTCCTARMNKPEMPRKSAVCTNGICLRGHRTYSFSARLLAACPFALACVAHIVHSGLLPMPQQSQTFKFAIACTRFNRLSSAVSEQQGTRG